MFLPLEWRSNMKLLYGGGFCRTVRGQESKQGEILRSEFKHSPFNSWLQSNLPLFMNTGRSRILLNLSGVESNEIKPSECRSYASSLRHITIYNILAIQF